MHHGQQVHVEAPWNKSDIQNMLPPPYAQDVAYHYPSALETVTSNEEEEFHVPTVTMRYRLDPYSTEGIHYEDVPQVPQVRQELEWVPMDAPTESRRYTYYGCSVTTEYESCVVSSEPLAIGEHVVIIEDFTKPRVGTPVPTHDLVHIVPQPSANVSSNLLSQLKNVVGRANHNTWAKLESYHSGHPKSFRSLFLQNMYKVFNDPRVGIQCHDVKFQFDMMKIVVWYSGCCNHHRVLDRLRGPFQVPNMFVKMIALE